VNDAVVRKLGAKADIGADAIRVDGKLIPPESSKVYLMLHKPRGYVTTLHDPQGRSVVADLLSGVTERVFPVGRLDYDSEGLLLLTNDGNFSLRVQHPRFRIPKTYMVKIGGILRKNEIRALSEGIMLNDGIFRPDGLRVIRVNKNSSWLELSIAEGRKRVIRRALESVGHPVVRIIRTAIAELRLGNTKAGMFRHLTRKEVLHLLSFTR